MSSELQAEIGGMTKGQLRTKAKELSIGQDDIDAAGEEDDEKAALTDLIRKNDPAAVLMKMTKGQLRAKARELSIGQKDIDYAGDKDDEKAALTDLILKNDPAAVLMKMSKGQLRAKAEEANVSRKDIDDAGEEEDEKAAIINLILSAPEKKYTVPEPQPEPEPDRELEPEPDHGRPALSSASHDQYEHGAFAQTKTDQVLLNLVNEVQDINLASLDMTEDGHTLEWPQICVVGGQSEGKSTLLSAIVSANMSSKMEFLPEGKGMVTRCPISVQMTKTKGQDKHSATVSKQRSGHTEEGTPGEGGMIPGPGADPTEVQLSEWGRDIQQRITAMQDDMVKPGEVTKNKIIVRLKGPNLPNLSLVDLPGLRQYDDEEQVGLKDRLEAMVTQCLDNKSTIILCVGPASADPSTWAGRVPANKMDKQGARTIGVVTKTDTIFSSGVETEDHLANQRQLKAVLDDARKVPYYAAYNPKPKDEALYKAAGFDLKGRLEGYFTAGRVGNVAIAQDLEKRLSTHLQEQLPALHDSFKKKLKVLEAELHHSLTPTWYIVEQLMLSYARLVQSYCSTIDDPEEIVSHRGLSGKTPEGEVIWQEEKSCMELLMTLMDDFSDKVKPSAMYEDAGAQESILFRSTEAVLKDVQDRRKQTEKIVAQGRAWVKDPRNWRTDGEVAQMLGKTLKGDLDGLCNDVLSGIKDGTDNLKGLFPVCNGFFDAVCKVTFTLEELGKDKKFRIDDFPLIKERLKKATDDRLAYNWDKVEEKAAETAKVPEAGVVNEKFMEIKEVQKALARVCAYAADPTARHPWMRHGGGGGDLSRTITVSVVDTALDTRDPPSGICVKQKVSVNLWPTVYAKIESHGDSRVHGLSFYTDQDDVNSFKGASIADVTGCTFMKQREPFMFQIDWYKIVLFGQHLTPKQVQFAFQDEDKRDLFYDALVNLGEGRPWNESAEQHATSERKREAREAREAEVAEQKERERVRQEELLRLADEEADEGAQAAEGVRREMAPAFRRGDLLAEELWALEDTASITKDKITERGRLFLYGSKVFLDFYTALKAAPLAFTDEQIQNEVNAESYRLWALMLVRVQTQQQIDSVSMEMNSRFFDFASATAPFSCSSIFGRVQISKMVAAHESSEYGVDDRRSPPGPERLLRQDDGIRDRENKTTQMATLRDLCRQFEATGLPEFQDGYVY